MAKTPRLAKAQRHAITEQRIKDLKQMIRNDQKSRIHSLPCAAATKTSAAMMPPRNQELDDAAGKEPLILKPRICEFTANLLIDGKSVKRTVIADDRTRITRIAHIKATDEAVRLSEREFAAFSEWFREALPDSSPQKATLTVPLKKKKRKARREQPWIISGGLPSLGKKR
jgi:hypothetical protein